MATIRTPYRHDTSTTSVVPPVSKFYDLVNNEKTYGEIKLQFREDGTTWLYTLSPRTDTVISFQLSQSGTVSSVGLAAPTSIFNVVNSPITGSGTLELQLNTQTANTVFAGPTAGNPDAVPTFRGLQIQDFAVLPTLSDWAAPTSVVNFNGQELTNLGIPTTGTSAATRDYVDAKANGYSWKSPVKGVAESPVATLSGTQTIEGVTYENGDAILLTANTTDNGVWIVSTGAWTRRADMDQSEDFIGARIPVIGSSERWDSLAITGFTLNTDTPVFSAALQAGDITGVNSIYKASLTTMAIRTDNVTIYEKDYSGQYKLTVKGSATPNQVLVSDGTDGVWNNINLTWDTVVGVLPISKGGTGASDVATAQANLNLRPGVDIQPYNSRLQSISVYPFEDGALIYFNATTNRFESVSAITGGYGGW